MDHYGKILRNLLLVFAVTAASVLGGCAKEPAPPAQTTAAQTTAATQTESQGMPTPMKEADSVLDFEAIGVHMVLPKEAESPSYYIINGEVADVQFTFDGTEYTYRASDTAQDFAGIFERFKEGVLTETAGSNGQETEVQVKTTESGGRLASWEWGSTKYTLYTASQVEDGEISSLAVTLAELGENEK